jgi:hypothetical protein
MASEDRAPSSASRRLLSLMGFRLLPAKRLLQRGCAACISLVAVEFSGARRSPDFE